MKFSDFFSNDFETKDNHKNEVLRTRYYRTDYEKMKEYLKKVFNDEKFELLSVDDNYHELHFYKVNVEVIVSVFSESYFKQGVDFKVNSNYIISRGRGLKLIDRLYNALDKNFEKARHD